MKFLHGFRLRRPAAALAVVTVLPFFAGLGVAQRASVVPADADVETITHALGRLTFGPRPGDVDRVRQMGLQSYIEQQLHPERIDDSALDVRLSAMPTLAMSSRELAQKYFEPADRLNRRQAARQTPANPAQMTPPPDQPPAARQMTAAEREIRQAAQRVTAELMQAKVLRAALSERQLEEVLVDFWFNHFNVFIGKGAVRQYITEYERDAIRPHVLGSFRDMLDATASSPAMLFYLDNFQSRTANPPVMVSPQMEQRLRNPRLSPDERRQLLQRIQTQQQRRPAGGLNENYARELMELHTLGVDGGYTQQDVINVARVFTGWTIDQPRSGGRFVFRPQMHDMEPKMVLGQQFVDNGGQEEGERVLDLLSAHPATARHIAFKLSQRFVADEPPASLVDRVARVFVETKGDLRAVTEAVITSPEFFSIDAYRAKVKTPLEFVVSAVRATGATVTNAQPLVAAAANLGMPLYGAQPPTGYSMTADAWVNTGALLARMNLAVQLISGTAPLAPGQNIRGEPMPAGVQGTPARGRGRGGPQFGRNAVRIDLQALAPDTSETTRDRLIASILAGQASAGTRETLARAESPQQLLALTLGSPEFQRR
ncbi:MAG TPA: DUF1800 domain-containing protein [Vicinamibacterales bacterium]|nr:DUF1800 domain-containing protein [Vicinamibacterales bacterium]